MYIHIFLFYILMYIYMEYMLKMLYRLIEWSKKFWRAYFKKTFEITKY